MDLPLQLILKTWIYVYVLSITRTEDIPSFFFLSWAMFNNVKANLLLGANLLTQVESKPLIPEHSVPSEWLPHPCLVPKWELWWDAAATPTFISKVNMKGQAVAFPLSTTAVTLSQSTRAGASKYSCQQFMLTVSCVFSPIPAPSTGLGHWVMQEQGNLRGIQDNVLKRLERTAWVIANLDIPWWGFAWC